MKTKLLMTTILLTTAFGCANTRDLTPDESTQITEQLRARTLQYADCWKRFGEKKSGAIEVKYLLAFGGAWETVEIDEEKSTPGYTPQMKDCIRETIEKIDLGVKPRTKVFGNYTIRFNK